MLGADEALRERHQIPVWPEEQALYEEVLARTRAALGGAAFLERWAGGRTMPLDDALALISFTAP